MEKCLKLQKIMIGKKFRNNIEKKASLYAKAEEMRIEEESKKKLKILKQTKKEFGTSQNEALQVQ